VYPIDAEGATNTKLDYSIKSLGFISIDNSVRKCLFQIVTGPRFDTIILVMIVLNSITMASVDYRYVNENYEPDSRYSWRNRAIEIAEVVFMVIFFLECMAKIIALGFVKGKDSYLRSAWNIFDFLIVIFR